MKTVFLALLTLAGALACLAAPQEPQSAEAWLVPAVVVVGLEVFSFPLALTPAGFLALLAAPPGGPKVACLLALALLAWRTLVRPRLELSQALAEALPVTLTGAIAVAVPAEYRLLAVLNVYLLLSAANRSHPELYPARLAVLATGALATTTPVAWLAAIPVLLVIRWGALARMQSVELKSHADRGRELERAQERILALEGRLGRATEELAQRQAELGVLAEGGQSLLKAPTFEETVETLLTAAQRLAFSESLAVFAPDESGRLLPMAYRSPHAQTLRDAALHQVTEPSVEQAWREQRALLNDFEQGPSRLFPDEASLTVPLPGFGVLYLGASHRQYGLAEQHLVGLLAGHAALTLSAAKVRQGEREALALHQKANRRLEEWLEQLARLLEATRSMSLLLEPQALLERLAELLPQLAPVTDYAIECRRPEARLGREGWQGYLERATVPLLLEEGLLVLPFPGERGGIVVQGAFSRAHQELLSLLTYQVAAILEGIALHQEVVLAYRKLQESEQQLIQAAKMAAVGQLAAGVAHELNTPLGSIRMAAELAQRMLSRSPEQAAGRLDTVQTAAIRAQEIVSKLLYYSRDARIDSQPYDLNQVVADALELVSHSGAQVDFQPGQTPEMRGNPNEIQQIVTNLVLNARDAVEEQSPERKIVRLRTRTDGGAAILEVADQGAGIQPEDLPRIFEPFYTTKPIGSGTGLGLSISQQLAERHHGRLTVESQPGRGTTFTVSLPCP